MGFDYEETSSESEKDEPHTQLGDNVREAMSRAGIDTGIYLSWEDLTYTVKQVSIFFIIILKFILVLINFMFSFKF